MCLLHLQSPAAVSKICSIKSKCEKYGCDTGVTVTWWDFSMILIGIFFPEVQTQCFQWGIDFQTLHQPGQVAGDGQATHVNLDDGWRG